MPFIESEPARESSNTFDNWPLSTDDQMKIEYWRDHNIDTTGLDSCRKLLLKKLVTALNSTPLGRILAKMDRANNEPTNIEKFKIKYQVKPLPPNVTGATDSLQYNFLTGIFSASIILDSATVKNSTDIYLATVIIHETLHAYLTSIEYRLRNYSNLSDIQAMGYDSLFNEYVHTIAATNNAQLDFILNDDQYHHNYMANKLVSMIGEALKLFDNNSLNDDRYYWFLSWSGLFQTEQWKFHWPNFATLPIVGAPLTTEDSTRRQKYALTPLRLDSIYQALQNEQFSNSNAKGHHPVPNGCY